MLFRYDARKAEVNSTIASLKRALQQSEKDEGELLEESTRIRRLKLGAENQRREYAREIVELKDHPYFVAVQFHPELKSTVANPHPLFVNFVAAALAHSHKK